MSGMGGSLTGGDEDFERDSVHSSRTMTAASNPVVYRFGVFEADVATGELRRQGVRVKLHAQPFQVLCLLLERDGGLISREEIAAELWPDGTFVDAEHGVNSAVNRLREALGDSAANPRFVETLARRGYRFVAPVEKIGAAVASAPVEVSSPVEVSERVQILASRETLPKASHGVVRMLFVLLQVMYLGFYVGALANLGEVEGLLTELGYSSYVLIAIVVTASVLIAVRAFLLSAFLFRAPGAGGKFLKLWPLLFPLDVAWAMAPFLLLHHVNVGVALACTALLVYSPFAQRSLVLMGAGDFYSQSQAD